jgi:outer membrane receptor for ferrienterochelin and colicins
MKRYSSESPSRFLAALEMTVCTVLAVLLVTNVAIAQQPMILGRIIDATSKDAVIGARITFDPEFLSDTLKTQLKSKGAVSKDDGSFMLATPDTGAFVLEIKQPGYEAAYIEFQSRLTHTDTLYAGLDREKNEDVVVTAKASSKTIEDLCCRIEELNAELSNVAPFTPDMQQVMSRYSSCTSAHINCTLDHSSSVRLRGMENPYTLMLLDGVPLFSAITTQYGMQMIPALATDNARIIEGASTSIYGNNAMAGVLSFDLKPPTEEREMFVQSNFMAEGNIGLAHTAYDINASARGSGKKAAAALVLSANSHPLEVGGSGPFGESPGLKRYSGYLQVTPKLNDETKIKLIALGGIDRRDVFVDPSESALEGTQTVRNNVLNLIGKIEQPLSNVSTFLLNAAASTAIHNVQHPSRTTLHEFDAMTPLSFELQSQVGYLQSLFTTGFGDHYLTTSAELRTENVVGDLPARPRSGALFRGLPMIYDFTTASFSAEDQISLADEWTLLAGGRFDHHSNAGIAVSPRASLSYRPAADWRMRFMAGQGIKGQALFNEDHRIMHGVYDYQYNEDFGYEKALSLSYDMTYTYTIGDEIGGQANFNVFYTGVSGRATPQVDSLAKGKMFYVNSAEPARMMGVEFQTRPSFNEYLSGSLAFSVINFTQVSSSGARERVPLSPTINADASLMFQDPATNFAAEVWGSIIGKQRLPENPYGVTSSPILGILNLRAQAVFGMITLHWGILNILDTKQSDTMPVAYASGNSLVTNIGFGPLEGREIFAGMRLTL